MRKYLGGICLALAAVLLLSYAVMAGTYSYTSSFTVYENGTNAYSELPVLVPINNTLLASMSYINSSGLNTNLEEGAISSIYSVADSKVGVLVDSLSAYQIRTYGYRMGYSPTQTKFPIIVGQNGNITALNSTTLQLGSNFDIKLNGYVRTDASEVGKTLVNKVSAFNVTVPSVGSLQANIIGATGGVTSVSFSCSSGYRSLDINADGASLGIGFISNTLNSTVPVSTASTLTDGYSAFPAPQRSSFYTNGRYWVFYTIGYGQDSYFRSSMDGITWSGATVIPYNAGQNRVYVAAATDGVYAHWVSNGNGGFGNSLTYLRGLLDTSGTISWDALQTVITNGAGGPVSIAVDSNGYPWIAKVGTFVGSGGLSVYKSDTKNGGWTTNATVTLIVGNDSNGAPHLLPLLGGRMYILYTASKASIEGIYGYEWKGPSLGWGANEPLTAAHTLESSLLSGIDADAVADGSGEVYFTWLEKTTYNIKGAVRHTTGAVSAISTLQTATTLATCPVMGYLKDIGKIYTFWASSPILNHIYYSSVDSTSQVWDASPVDWRTESFTVPVACLSAGYWSWNGRLPILWTNDMATDEMKFCALRVDTPSTYAPILESVPVNASDWSFFDNCTVSYIDNITISVGGSSALVYEPNTMLLTTNLPDRSGNGNTGVVNWGTNPADVVVTIGAFSPFTAYQMVGASEENVPSLLPTSHIDAYGDPAVDTSHFFIYDSVHRAALALKWTEGVTYTVFFIIAAMAVGVAFLYAVPLLFSFIIGFGVTFGALMSSGAGDPWMNWIVVAFAIAMGYVARQS